MTAGEMFQKVLPEIEYRLKTVKIDRTHHVPYMGGQSKDRNVVYIDSRVPEVVRFKGHTYNVIEYLAFHEVVEKTIEDLLGTTYNTAHREAEWAQIKAMKDAGLDPVPYNEWESAFYPWTLKHFDPRKVPADLDLKPYIEDKKVDVLEKMQGVKR